MKSDLKNVDSGGTSGTISNQKAQKCVGNTGSSHAGLQLVDDNLGNDEMGSNNGSENNDNEDIIAENNGNSSGCNNHNDDNHASGGGFP